VAGVQRIVNAWETFASPFARRAPLGFDAAIPFKKSSSGSDRMDHLNRRNLLLGTAATTAAAVAPGAFAPARAAAPAAGKQAPGFYRYKVGDFEITAITDGTWLPDLAPGLFKNFSVDDARKALADQFQRTDKLVVPITPLMVNTGSKLVLIDTGTAGVFTPTSASFMDNLTAAGFDPKQVDIVLISHFHGDHINGLRTKDGQLVFPNAEVKVPATEWSHWMDDAKMNAAPEAARGNFNNSRRVFASIGKDVTRFDWEKEVAPGITSVAAPGHTPGHTAFVISSGNQSMMTIVDATNNAYLFVRNPEWQVVFDMDGPLAVETRKKLLDRAVADKLLVGGYHWPFPAAGHIAKEGSGYRLHPVAWNSVL
jgi:glyoxylase-like metal-dependent hydrolase (beta-lactamase superfamily II)